MGEERFPFDTPSPWVQDTGLVVAADLPLAGNDGVIRPVLVDPGTEPGRSHGESHQPAPYVREPASPFFARQPHEAAGFVNEEQIARVVKILPHEILGSELELDFIVA